MQQCCAPALAARRRSCRRSRTGRSPARRARTWPPARAHCASGGGLPARAASMGQPARAAARRDRQTVHAAASPARSRLAQQPRAAVACLAGPSAALRRAPCKVVQPAARGARAGAARRGARLQELLHMAREGRAAADHQPRAAAQLVLDLVEDHLIRQRTCLPHVCAHPSAMPTQQLSAFMRACMHADHQGHQRQTTPGTGPAREAWGRRARCPTARRAAARAV